MLQVVLDSDTRAQAGRFIDWFARSPTGDPFISDTLVVADRGTGLWLARQLAARQSISANLAILQPRAYIWASVQQRQARDGALLPFDPRVVRWAIHDALAGAPAAPELAPVRSAWLRANQRDRVVLCGQIAEQFEHYLGWRRDWLDAWLSGASPARAEAARRKRSVTIADTHEPWQRWLWQALLERVTGFGERHPFDVFRDARRQTDGLLAADSAGKAVGSGRVALFGAMSLAPEQMGMLGLLAQQTPMIWFAPDPAQGFWEDLVGPRAAAALAQRDPEDAWLYESEPQVLGEWGRDNRDLLVQIRGLERDGLAQIHDDSLRSRDPAPVCSLLGAVQASLFSLSDDPLRDWFGAQAAHIDHDHADRSLEVHATHSLTRQCDVVADCLLAALADLPDLQWSDIGVFCVDVNAVAPLLLAVLDEQVPAGRIPVQVGGLSSQSNAHVRALLGLLRMVDGPIRVQAVLDWLSGPVPSAAAGVTQEAMARLRHLVNRAGIHQDDVNDATARLAHGWQSGIDRLMLGMLMGDAGSAPDADPGFALGEPMAGVLPVADPPGADSAALGRLVELLDELARWRRLDAAPHPLSHWLEQTGELIDRWLRGPGPDSEAVLDLRDALRDFAQCFEQLRDHARPLLSAGAFAEALDTHLQATAMPARASAAVTVAPLGSLTHVPFRVRFLVGLDEGRWPPAPRADEFDLQRHLPRFGDADPQSAARGIFLQALTDTDDRLVITYTGRGMRADERLNPARPLAELLDWLRAADQGPGSAQAGLIVNQHPLQPFSPRRFDSSARMASYSVPWYEAANALASDARDGHGFGPVIDDDARFTQAARSHWDARELARALYDPVGLFMRDTAGIALPDAQAPLDDIEPMGVTDLPRWAVNDLAARVAGGLARGDPPERILARLRAEPALPAGPGIEPLWRRVHSRALRIARRDGQLLASLGLPAEALASSPMALDVQLRVTDPAASTAITTITGRIARLFDLPDGTRLLCLPAVAELDARALVDTWIQHLLLLGSVDVSQPVLTIRSVVAEAEKNDRRLSLNRHSIPMIDQAAGRPDHAWQTVLDAARRASSQVCPVFPKTALAWLEAVGADEVADAIDDPIGHGRGAHAAEKTFEGDDSRFATPESQNRWARALWRGQPPDLHAVLVSSLAIYAPIWLAVQRLLEPFDDR